MSAPRPFNFYLRFFVPLAGMLLAACGGPKQPPEAVANEFLSDLKTGKVEAAYALTNFAFQAQQNVGEFTAKVQDLKLDQSTAAKWTRTEDTPGEVTLAGKITVGTDMEIPLNITFYQQSRHWLISGMATDAIGQSGEHVQFSVFGQPYSFSTTVHHDMPAADELLVLVRQTLSDFNKALDQKDFTSFYDTVSHTWQSQISVSRFGSAFQPFLDQGVQLGGIEKAPLKYDREPVMDGHGILQVQGIAGTQPQASHFGLRFVYEVPKWRLFAITVEMLKPEDKAAASPAASGTPTPPATSPAP
ncbi:MAG: hypothetical protein QM796_06330 [Chthoniobacteraceae bacterium]